jgi:predicted GNAT family N-acyltransferase
MDTSISPMTGSEFAIERVVWEHARGVLSEIRRQVFIEEQGVPPELEWDEEDPRCVHVLARLKDGRGVGTARMCGTHIGRMAVLAPWRRRGVGTALLQALLDLAREEGAPRVRLHAQVHAVEFYRAHGFVAAGGQFMEAGIPHIQMHIDLSDPETPS